MTDRRIGEIVGGSYRITGVLGEGGMGIVYEASHLELARKVAIKGLHAHLAEKNDMLQRFRREALAASAIGHEHIVEVFDMGRFGDGTMFLMLELLEGRDLALALSADGPMRVDRLVHVASQICEALGAAHDKGIVHRDLKPENVFLIERAGDADFVKLLDFGVSKFREGFDGELAAMTRTGTTIGTPYYMAPEQAQGLKDIDGRVDLYSLGVILFRALTGQHPFDDPSFPMLVLKICTEAPPPVRRYRADVPEALDALVMRLLAKHPEERPSNADEVRVALAPFREVHDEPRVTDAPATSASRAQALAHRVDSPEAHAATAAAVSVPNAWMSGPGVAHAAPAPAAVVTASVASSRSVATPDAEARARELDAMDAEDVDRAEERIVSANKRGISPLPMLAIAGALILGLGVTLFLTMDDDTAVEREATLPTPAPAEVRALVAPGHGGIGWTWMNPLPRAMPTWYDVSVASAELVAMVGHAGQAARVQSDGMYLWDTGTNVTLHGVTWYGAREAIAVGDDGVAVLLRIDQPPERIDVGTDVDLRDVVAVSPTSAWIVGDRGTLIRTDGYRTATVATGTEQDLVGAFAAGDVVWIVGAEGTLLRVEHDRVVADTSGTSATLRAVGGCPGQDLYVAGDEGTLMRRDDEGRFIPVVHEGHEPLSAIGCNDGHAVITGLRGGVFLAARGRTVRLESGTDRSLQAVSSARGAPTWIVGDSGRLMHVERDHVRTLTDGPTSPLWDLGTISGALVGVGEWGRIVREHEHGFRLGESPTDDALAALTALDDSTLLAVGDLGAIVSIRHDGARLLGSPSTTSWRDVIGDASGVLAVGTGGALLRGAPEALTESRVADAGDLWAVSGTPADALAVGSDGLVLRVDADHSVRIPCSTDVGLRGVAMLDEGAWAVGDHGVIVRIEGARCTTEVPPTPGASALNAVGPGPNGRPIAVGNLGVALERAEDGTWGSAGLAVGRMNLRAITRDARNVYVAGAGGVIVRHVRLDGG